MKCPKCGSGEVATYKHPNAKEWCVRCAFVLRDEGATEYNEYSDEPKTRSEAEPEEIISQSEDMNIVVLTDEHLQKIITAAVKDGIKEYKNSKLVDEVASKLMKMGIIPYGDEIKKIKEEYKEE